MDLGGEGRYPGGGVSGEGEGKILSTTRPEKHDCVFLVSVKSDLSSVHWTIHVLRNTTNTVPCITGHPVANCTNRTWGENHQLPFLTL